MQFAKTETISVKSNKCKKKPAVYIQVNGELHIYNFKNHKKVILYPPAHRLNVNVLLSNITFL